VQGYKSLAQWRAYSGKDTHSTEMVSDTLTTAELFYNDTQTARLIYLTRPYVDLGGQPVEGTLTQQPFASRILIPAGPLAPNLTIAKLAPSAVRSSDWITYTLSVANQGGAAAAHLVVTDALPAHTDYVGGGTRVGDVISWTATSLEPGAAITFTFVVTPVGGIKVIVNGDYVASAEGGYRAAGAPVATLVDPLQVYLPLITRAP
jgi:uncharacterized repeat protein (TIGR01451 family)